MARRIHPTPLATEDGNNNQSGLTSTTPKTLKRGFLSSLLHSVEKFVVSCIRALPAGFRYYLTIIAFWPTVCFNRLYCWFFPKRRKLWNRIPLPYPTGPSLIVGSVPFREADVEALVKEHKVGGIVNMCKEWDAHSHPTQGLYAKHAVEQIHLPTIDFDAPSVSHLVQGCAWMKTKLVDEKKTVYVHCKAGRGRSVAMCLAYMILHLGMSPSEADSHIRGIRPHISKKWKLAEIAEIVRLRDEKGGGVLSNKSGATTSPAVQDKTEVPSSGADVDSNKTTEIGSGH